MKDGELSTTYTKDGKSLTDVLEADVRNSIEISADSIMDAKGIPEREKTLIKLVLVHEIMNCYDVNYDKHNFDTKTSEIYDLVVADIKSKNSGCSSDIYGGFTGNTLIGNTGHATTDKSGERESRFPEGVQFVEDMINCVCEDAK